MSSNKLIYKGLTLKIFFIIVFLWLFYFTPAQTKKALIKEINHRGEAYILIKLPDNKTLYKLSRKISIDKVDKENGFVYAYITNPMLHDFNKMNLNYTVKTAPSMKIEASMCTDLNSVKNWNCYPTYSQYINLMNEFTTNYPELCKLEEIGKSVDGRSVLSLKISDSVSKNEEEPAFFYTSTMHGDEVTGYVLLLRLIDYLLSNYQTDTRIKHLLDSTEIWINPLANPDGTYAAGENTITGAKRFNANGFDLNRNFPDPQDGEYSGGTRQTETQDMMNFLSSHHFVFSANFHGGAEVVNYPWDRWSRTHADDNWYIKISRQYADTVHTNSSSYMTDLSNGITNGYTWYPINGGRQDYVNYYLHSRETTIELSSAKIPDAGSLPMYWNYNYRSLLNYINCVHTGIYGKVTDENGNPLKAKLTVQNHDTDSSEIYSNPANGMYYRMIAGGNYDLIFSAPGYSSVSYTNINVVDDDKIRLDVSLKKIVASISDINHNNLQINKINNPFNNTLLIDINVPNAEIPIIIGIYDLSGKEYKKTSIKSVLTGNNLISLNTEDLKSGLYLLRLQSDNLVVSRKIVKK